MVFSAFFTLGICLAPSLGTPEQSPPPATEGASPKADAARTEQEADSREHLTAEDVLKALQRQRPPSQTIPPVGSEGEHSGQAVTELFPEGFPVVGVTGTIERDTDDSPWWRFVSDESAGLPPLKVLRNLTLEPMERTVLGTEVTPTFEVDGTMTVFDGENYLLIGFAISRHVRPPPGSPAPGGASGDQDGTHAKPEDEPHVATDAAAEDVLEQLLQEGAAEQPVSIAAVTRGERPDAPPVDRRPLVSNGAPMIRRPARLVRHGDWWTLVFESDHPDKPEPPMKVLPNKNLEVMARGTAHGSAGVVFVVSGVVTVFDNENYALISAARRRLDSGNLRK